MGGRGCPHSGVGRGVNIQVHREGCVLTVEEVRRGVGWGGGGVLTVE